nr:hypothetical protein B0A51_09759 [Rachicladosporium sp. CCFEE 5018]
MRLYNVVTCTFQQFHSAIPPYIIASHRWGNEEVTYQDVEGHLNTYKSGYVKLCGFLDYVRQTYPFIHWLWIDTCCIDKTNSVELSEAINSMFKWYRNAAVCLAYLSDVDFSAETRNADESGARMEGSAYISDDLKRQLQHSEWFSRGWTLQELVAPRLVVFLSRQWEVIGFKGRGFFNDTSFVAQLAALTRVPSEVLHDSREVGRVSAEQKIRCALGRETIREEDLWYCLFGLLDAPIGTNYGEGSKHARRRLLAGLEEAGLIATGRAAILGREFDERDPEFNDFPDGLHDNDVTGSAYQAALFDDAQANAEEELSENRRRPSAETVRRLYALIVAQGYSTSDAVEMLREYVATGRIARLRQVQVAA